ncbi:MAG: hypothetical protein Q7S40_30050 [Opitutaceae bacterium]|nr:hypothetical protein [Opitutaceae bacterium]
MVEMARARAPSNFDLADTTAIVLSAVAEAARAFVTVPVRPILLLALAVAGTVGHGAARAAPPDRLKLAVVQMALAPTLDGNRDRITP